MPVRKPLDLERELLEAFDHSARVTEFLVGALPREVWRATPPGGEVRTIAAIVAHMQGIRRTFAKMGGAPALPALDRLESTPAEAQRALRASREALMRLFADALAEKKARVARMPRRTVNMMLYLIQHDAHHRGQIAIIAHALGHRLQGDVVMQVWGWRKLTEPPPTDLTAAPRATRGSGKRAAPRRGGRSQPA